MYLRALYSMQVRRLASHAGTLLKPYPSYVERQVELRIRTSTGDDVVEINRDTAVQMTKPASYMKVNVNYVDTNPLGEKNQSLVLLVHGYPGTHESTRNFIEEFQRRNFRCIAPDMPCKRRDSMPLAISSLVFLRLWQDDDVLLQWNALGELRLSPGESSRRTAEACHGRQTSVGAPFVLCSLTSHRSFSRPIHAVVGFHENAYALMSMIDQYEYFHCQSLIMVDPAPRKLIR